MIKKAIEIRLTIDGCMVRFEKHNYFSNEKAYIICYLDDPELFFICKQQLNTTFKIGLFDTYHNKVIGQAKMVLTRVGIKARNNDAAQLSLVFKPIKKDDKITVTITGQELISIQRTNKKRIRKIN